MPTLVISDIHLGSSSRSDVLRVPALREPLLELARGAERVVLLGDLLELRHGPLHDALSVARPVLREIGERLGSGSESGLRSQLALASALPMGPNAPSASAPPAPARSSCRRVMCPCPIDAPAAAQSRERPRNARHLPWRLPVNPTGNPAGGA